MPLAGGVKRRRRAPNTAIDRTTPLAHTHIHTHTHTHTHTHARPRERVCTRTHTHAYTHIQFSLFTHVVLQRKSSSGHTRAAADTHVQHQQWVVVGVGHDSNVVVVVVVVRTSKRAMHQPFAPQTCTTHSEAIDTERGGGS
jgi:hypothetical protein